MPIKYSLPATGNLFTEKVTKRDIFYVFHKYGRLAQISMKSAYGFVQYHDSNACMRALQSEQGIELRGRKIRELYRVSEKSISADWLFRSRSIEAAKEYPQCCCDSCW